jgi:DNA-binding transcriptional LysR family regulator
MDLIDINNKVSINFIGKIDMEPTLHQLLCFDAVVSEGSFQAAAEKIRRAQPSVSAAVKNLEGQLGLTLLDRSGYRVVLTEAGRSFHERTRIFLHELEALKTHAAQLAMGEESELRVVIGDLCPLPQTLALLRRFFDDCPGTRLHLYFEAIAGPWERLLDGDADLILHHIDKSDPRFEHVDLFSVSLIPVVAPGFLRFPVSRSITLGEMRDYVQCVIRDTVRHSPSRDYFMIEGARSWTVSDQLMKRELILQGMGWGHMPKFLIDDDLRKKRLLNIGGRHLRGGVAEIVAARRRESPHGPIARRLWRYINERASSFVEAIK